MAGTTSMLFALVLSIHVGNCQRASVVDYVLNQKFSCPDAKVKTYAVASEMQCIHKCLRCQECATANFNAAGDVKENCEVLLSSSCSTTFYSKNWKGIVIQRETQPPKVYASCKEIFSDNGGAPSGVYNLASGRHFCNMSSIPGCGGGGWTLAMKVDGLQNTFTASSAYWTNDVNLNVASGLESFFEKEAKFPAFSNVSFDEICIGIRVSLAVQWLLLPVKEASLLTIFKSGNSVTTALGRAAWKGMIASSSLQLNCNREGLNVKKSDNTIVTRIGIFANQENDCVTPDSYIGLGGQWSSCCNHATISPDNGDRNTRGMGYVLVK